MKVPFESLDLVETWLRDMRYGGAETAEDALADVWTRLPYMSAEQARDVAPTLARVSELARSAQLLWRQVAVDADAPAYSARP